MDYLCPSNHIGMDKRYLPILRPFSHCIAFNCIKLEHGVMITILRPGMKPATAVSCNTDCRR